MNPATANRPLLREVAWALMLSAACILVVYGVFAIIQYRWQWDAIWLRRVLILKGWGTTVLISIIGMVASILIGMALMLGQRSPFIPVRQFSRAVVELIRGMPLLVLLLLGYYGVANAFRIHQALPVAVVLLALFQGAYLAEIFRGAWESIGASQIEAARAVGFDRYQTWRFVIFPQALRRALPGTAGQLVSLVKDSSLLSVIGVQELTQAVRSANAQAYTALEGYVPLALLYLVLTLPISWWARRLEERYKYET
ncbi:amino acid ABC transporter membrane protein (PAAT family) [Roseimicrobium gellanilyticum]|uniref:Amino acid ABC transporter membrane protein (PAAT family) n=1 Tax=Roseimicrobium gellanilyticum TaxID=748857 RepID=A0A366HVT3_9BACT|nr:amino acid ABC transporter permease [Roseimicrobium gellanilyticum]RBP47408.1 amino acid ABC transporter membrane protein (PAAT family) [Roseimicrobium gellanilyticum]